MSGPARPKEHPMSDNTHGSQDSPPPSGPTAEVTSWLAESESEFLSREVPPLDQAQDVGMPEVLYPALDWLAERGVQSVSVSYDGSGDEGLIEDTGYEPAPAGGVPPWIEDALKELAYHFL